MVKGKRSQSKESTTGRLNNILSQLAPATSTMNNEQQQQQSSAPEHYFATIDEDGEIPNPHDVAITEGMFSFPGYMPMDTGDNSQTEASFFHLSDATGNPAPSSISTYSYQPGHDWHHAGHHMVFQSPVSTTGEANSSLGNFGYMPYGEHQGNQVESFSPSFEHGYVPTSNLDHAVSYAYDWNVHGAQSGQTSEHDMASSHSGTGQNSALMSPVEARPGARTPSSFTSTSSGGHFSTMYAGTTSINPHVAASISGGSAIAPERNQRQSSSASKKGKGKQKPTHSRRSSGKAGTAPAPPASAFTSSSGESSLSGGVGPSSSRGSRSSTSSRMAQPATERLEDKKTRGTHNLVEKQYRSRLNARFEDLVNALPPESLRSPSSGLGDSSKATATADSMERRASKAEVLEMARQHIQQLEQRRDNLVHERDELLGTSQRLQQIYASQSPAHGQASDMGNDNDEKGDGDEAGE